MTSRNTIHALPLPQMKPGNRVTWQSDAGECRGAGGPVNSRSNGKAGASRRCPLCSVTPRGSSRGARNLTAHPLVLTMPASLLREPYSLR